MMPNNNYYTDTDGEESDNENMNMLLEQNIQTQRKINEQREMMDKQMNGQREMRDRQMNGQREMMDMQQGMNGLYSPSYNTNTETTNMNNIEFVDLCELIYKHSVH